MAVIGGNRSGFDGLSQVGIAPPPAGLLMPVIKVGKKETEFMEAAGVKRLFAEKPEKLIEDKAAKLKGLFGVTRDVTRQQPSVGVTRQIGGADGALQIPKRKR